MGQETVLGRTLRQLDAAKWPAVVVGPETLSPEIAGRARLLTLDDPGTCVLDGLAQLGDLFDGATVRVFLGDVFWSQNAFEGFLAEPRSFFFAGQHSVSATGGELFGLGFDTDGCKIVMSLLGRVACRRVHHDSAQPGHLRNLLFLASEADRPLRDKLYSWRFLRAVDDWTTDFDRPEDLARVPCVALAAAAEAEASLRALKGPARRVQRRAP